MGKAEDTALLEAIFPHELHSSLGKFSNPLFEGVRLLWTPGIELCIISM